MKVGLDTPSIAAADLLDHFIRCNEARIHELEARLEESEIARPYTEVGAGCHAGRLEQLYRRLWWQLSMPEKPDK